MKALIRSFVLLAFIGLFPAEMFAWEGMPTPPLHVEGNKLKDPTGKDVLLHGWFQPTSSYFNGHCYSDPTDWTDTSNVAGMLNFLNDAATIMSDTSPKYGYDHGWYSSFVRINTDAIGGWTSVAGLVDTTQFDAWISNFLVPYANHLSSRGIYLVLCATGPINTPNNGAQNAGVVEQQRLITFWQRVANAPGIKNANNIHFELMNEPVLIESSPGNGDWGMNETKYFEAFRDWIQPVIDVIRNTGAENVIWVPTLEWQGSPQQHAQFPFTGSNCGIAAHFYPAYGGCHNNTTCIENLWNSHYKPAADQWPMIITEMGWDATGDSGLGDGSTVGWGNTAKSVIDNQGNVSYNIGFLDGNITLDDCLDNSTLLTSNDGAVAAFNWWPTYTWAAPDDGTPKFKYASVTDNNPKQIKVTVSHSIQELNDFDGFTVKLDGQAVGIDGVVLGDTTNQLVISLSDNIIKDNEITLSYSNGNVVSIYEKNLVNFNDTLVDNLLEGAAPRITDLATNEDGDTLLARFNFKMQLPADLSDLMLNAQYDGAMSIPVLDCSFVDNDSTLLSFSLKERVYADYRLLFSYSGNNIVSADGGLLKIFSDILVTNNSQGLPVQIVSGKIEPDGKSGTLEFSKPLEDVIGKSDNFIFKINGTNVSFLDFYSFYNTIWFTLSNNLHYGDTATISYTTGDITAADKGYLEDFSDFPLTNLVNEPRWVSIPTKIQAENYYLQSGTGIENTSDEGGGSNVGWISDGDWLEYAIENKTSETFFEISFRIASPNSGSIFDLYLDNKIIDQVTVPNTGGWQSWQSVVDNITIEQGKHYLKLVAVNGGFNINYIEIKQVETGIEDANDSMVDIYPNPASKRIVIRSTDFQYNNIEIIDAMGKAVLRRSAAYEPELHLPVNLADGVYILKVSNEKEFRFKKIIIRNE